MARNFPDTPSDLPKTEDIRGLSGLQFMQSVMAGDLPAAPIAKTLGFDLIEVEAGRAVFAGEPLFQNYNPIGSVHGGCFGVLLDSCMGCAVHTALPAGRTYTTLEFKVNVLRAARVGDSLIRAEGQTVHVGRRTATAEGRMVDADGKLYATGTTTCLVMDLP